MPTPGAVIRVYKPAWAGQVASDSTTASRGLALTSKLVRASDSPGQIFIWLPALPEQI